MKVKYTVILLDKNNKELGPTVVEIPDGLTERQIDVYLYNHTCSLKPRDLIWEEVVE